MDARDEAEADDDDDDDDEEERCNSEPDYAKHEKGNEVSACASTCGISRAIKVIPWRRTKSINGTCSGGTVVFLCRHLALLLFLHSDFLLHAKRLHEKEDGKGNEAQQREHEERAGHGKGPVVRG